MKLLGLLPAAALLSGCAAIPDEATQEQPRDAIRDPARIHGFFLRMIREDLPGKAALVTTLAPEPLTMGIHNRIAPDLTRRIILGFEQHEVRIAEDRSFATARWCNPEFGLSHEFRLRSELGGKLWKLEITQELIEDFARAGLAWFKKQREAADGRIYAYPPDWVATNVSNRCGCGR